MSFKNYDPKVYDQNKNILNYDIKKPQKDQFNLYNQFQNPPPPPPRYKIEISPDPQDRFKDSNQGSFSLSKNSRSRSHSREPTPNKYNYQNQNPNQDISKSNEKIIQNEPLYYKDPFQQSQPPNPYNQPNYYDYAQKKGPAPLNDKPYYEYEKNVTANFDQMHSNSFPADDRMRNELNYQTNYDENMERGISHEKGVMNYDDKREYNITRNPMFSNSQNPTKRSKEVFHDYPQTGFEKLFVAHSITMKPVLLQRDIYDTPEVYYHIYPGEITKGRTYVEPLFVFTFQPGFCSKYCLTADCRSINITVRHPSGKEFLQLTRECSCTVLCSNRPQMFVKYVEEGSQNQIFNLGTILNPFVCFDYEMHVNLENGTPRYVINSEWCTCNMYCCFSCDFCNKSSFNIMDSNYNPMSKIQSFTHYQLCRPFISEDDGYVLDFPPYSTREDRALLLACLIFLDFRYMANRLE